jgi:hypothetical protein
LENNNSLLKEAQKREDDLKNKYCNDIQKAVSLNKQLNNIISKKNKLIADIKIKQNKKECDIENQKNKLYQENANLYNEYIKFMETKENEKILIEEQNQKLKNNIQELEVLKLKSEYKSNILEEENKKYFDDMIGNICKKSK